MIKDFIHTSMLCEVLWYGVAFAKLRPGLRVANNRQSLIFWDDLYCGVQNQPDVPSKGPVCPRNLKHRNSPRRASREAPICIDIKLFLDC